MSFFGYHQAVKHDDRENCLRPATTATDMKDGMRDIVFLENRFLMKFHIHLQFAVSNQLIQAPEFHLQNRTKVFYLKTNYRQNFIEEEEYPKKKIIFILTF